MTGISTDLVEVCDYVLELLKSNRANVGLEDVFYGDQDRLNTTPVACVEPETEVHRLREAALGRITDLAIRFSVIIYHSFVQSPQSNRHGSDVMARAVKNLLNADGTLGGLLIHGYCIEVQSGYSRKSGALVRSNRILYEGRSKAVLPSG